MEISKSLLKFITCPLTDDKLIYDRDNQELVSVRANLAYPIVDSIPILLIDRARKVNGQMYLQLTEENDPTKENSSDITV